MNLFVENQPIALTIIFSYLLPSSNRSQTIRLADLYNFIVSGSTIQKSFATNNSFWLWLLEHKLDCILCIRESRKLNTSMSPIDGYMLQNFTCKIYCHKVLLIFSAIICQALLLERGVSISLRQ